MFDSKEFQEWLEEEIFEDIEEYLSSGADLNEPDKYGMTVMHYILMAGASYGYTEDDSLYLACKAIDNGFNQFERRKVDGKSCPPPFDWGGGSLTSRVQQYIDTGSITKYSFDSLEEALKCPENVKKLSINGSRLGDARSLLPEISKFTNLEYFGMNTADGIPFPEAIWSLHQLKSLHIGSGITEIEDRFEELPNLERISFYVSSLKTLPSSIRTLKNLRELDFYCAFELTELPEWLPEITTLEKLRFAENDNLFEVTLNAKDFPNLDEESRKEISNAKRAATKRLKKRNTPIKPSKIFKDMTKSLVTIPLNGIDCPTFLFDWNTLSEDLKAYVGPNLEDEMAENESLIPCGLAMHPEDADNYDTMEAYCNDDTQPYELIMYNKRTKKIWISGMGGYEKEKITAFIQ